MSNQKKLQVGDIVKLKSGGPDMTIKDILTNLNDEETGSYRCQWFAGKKLDNGLFPLESLVIVIQENE